MYIILAYLKISVHAYIGTSLKNNFNGGSVTKDWSKVANERVLADIYEAL